MQKTKKKRLVLFLCTGDTCRGPMAAGYLRKVLEEHGIKDIEVRSAGVMTATGLLSTPEAVQLLEPVAVDLRRHRSTQLTHEMLRKSDLVLGMTPFHVQYALRVAEDAKGKTHLFKEYTNSDPKNYQITDPMGHTLEVYKRVFREIRQACEFLANMEFVTGKSPAAVKAKEAAKKKSAAAGKKSGAANPKTPPAKSKADAAKKTAADKKTAAGPKASKPKTKSSSSSGSASGPASGPLSKKSTKARS
jgi:protein-tyrosine-phosphatase